jgi:hypothetical protein
MLEASEINHDQFKFIDCSWKKVYHPEKYKLGHLILHCYSLCNNGIYHLFPEDLKKGKVNSNVKRIEPTDESPSFLSFIEFLIK